MKKQLRNDLILISIILTVALLTFFAVKITAKKGNLVKVTVNGETVFEYSLEKDINFSAVLETLVRIIEQEDKDMQANEKGN